MESFKRRRILNSSLRSQFLVSWCCRCDQGRVFRLLGCKPKPIGFHSVKPSQRLTRPWLTQPRRIKRDCSCLHNCTVIWKWEIAGNGMIVIRVIYKEKWKCPSLHITSYDSPVSISRYGSIYRYSISILTCEWIRGTVLMDVCFC